MGSNSRTQNINYTPRYTQLEAYDLLPMAVRDALKEGPQEWDTGAILRQYRKLLKSYGPNTAQRKVVSKIQEWTAEEIAEGYPWRPRKPGQRWEDVSPSPHNQARATMVLSK